MASWGLQQVEVIWERLRTQPSSWGLLLPAAAAIVVLVFVRTLLRAYATPLRHIPGPFLAKFSSLPLTLAGLRLKQAYYVQDAFERYGPVVRIAPNVVVSNDRNDLKKVYGSVKVIKAPFYDSFAVINGERVCLSLRDPTEAMHRRRCYLPLFARKNLLGFAPRIYAHMQEFIEKLRQLEGRGEVVDALRWWRYLTFDVVTDLTFAGKFDMVKTGERDHPFVQQTEGATKWSLLTSIMPPLNTVPAWLLPQSLRTLKEHETSSLQHPIEALAAWKAENAAGTLEKGRSDAINTLMKHGDQYPSEKLTDAQIIAALQELMVAGSDTTAMTAAFICYELSRNLPLQDRLAAELRQAVRHDSSTEYTPATLDALENCKLLDAVCKEGLRVHPSVMTILERVSPPEGMLLAGKRVPAGTIVAMQAYSRHLDDEVYPNPTAFVPERWLTENEQMRASMLAFSTGPRACVGQNLAQLQLRLYIGTVLREFQVTLHPSTTEAKMRKTDAFLAKPIGGKCLLYFKSRK